MANGTWRLTTRRGNAQLPLAVAAVLAVALVLLGRAQSGLFDRARANITDWMSPALELVHAPVEAVNTWASEVGNLFRVYSENIRLREENARLKQWQAAATLMDERVKRYQLLLHAVPDPALSSIVARVIGRASRPFDQTIILDAGKANGVKPGQAVVNDRGMIGRIFLSGNHTSWVVLVTDLNSRIPVTIKPGNVQALLAGDNSPTPRLEDFSQNAQLKPGDSIVTSGDGGLLPAGLTIGTLVQTNIGLRVMLLVDPQNVDDVEVLDYKSPIEPLPAPSVNDLPAAAAGLAPAAPPPEQPLQALPLQTPGAMPAPGAAMVVPHGAAVVTPAAGQGSVVALTPKPVKPQAAAPKPGPATVQTRPQEAPTAPPPEKPVDDASPDQDQ
jgi:rod shape-determining protein MreC